jgi:cation transport ATPase
MKKYRYDVSGMSCAACVGHVEHAANKVLLKLISKEKDDKKEEKRYDVTVSLLTSSMTIEIEDAIVEKIGKDRIDRALTEEITHAGYHVKAVEEGKIIEQKDAREAAKQDKRSLRRSWMRWTLSALLMIVLMLFSMGPRPGVLSQPGGGGNTGMGISFAMGPRPEILSRPNRAGGAGEAPRPYPQDIERG